jgi:hypothetical protein
MTIHLALPLLTLLVGTLLPAVTALVTDRFASTAWKTGVLAVLALLASAGQQAITNGGDFDVAGFVGTAVAQLVVAIATHYTVLKPAGLTGTNGAIARRFPLGIGASRDGLEV